MPNPVEQYKARLDKATASRGSESVPFAAAIAADSNGTLLHKLESGSFIPHAKNPSHQESKDSSGNVPPQPFTADTVCWIASCTKLMTTIAVLQCCERNLLSLDDDVSEGLLPEFKSDIKILRKIAEDSDGEEYPVYQDRTQPLTLRHLLTHSSGIAYEFTHPKLQGWRSLSMSTKQGKAQARSHNLAHSMRVPLLFEPGTSWVYGYGIDWAGLAVMRATASSLEEYMRTHIWGPLHMHSTTFSLQRHRPDLYARYAGMTVRDDEGNVQDGDGGPIARGVEQTHYAGGSGCFSTANDYIKLLSSILNTAVAATAAGGYDSSGSASGSSSSGSSGAQVPQLISPDTARTMFRSHLSDASLAALREMESNALAYGLAGNMSLETATSFALGGILNIDAIPSCGRAAGGMQWGGLPNLLWWISPGDGVCGCYFSQILPPGDRVSFEMGRAFEGAVLQERKRLASSARL